MRVVDLAFAVLFLLTQVIPDLESSLAQLGDTLSSRLYEMCRVVEMEGVDFRSTFKQASYDQDWVKRPES